MFEPEQTGRYARQVAAMIRAIDDPESLHAVRFILAQTDRLMTTAVNELRNEGFSNAEMARACGVTRDAIAKRYPRV